MFFIIKNYHMSKKQKIILGAVISVVIILVTLFFLPQVCKQNSLAEFVKTDEKYSKIFTEEEQFNEICYSSGLAHHPKEQNVDTENIQIQCLVPCEITGDKSYLTDFAERILLLGRDSTIAKIDSPKNIQIYDFLHANSDVYPELKKELLLFICFIILR